MEAVAGKANGAFLERGGAAFERYPAQGVVAALAVWGPPPEPPFPGSFSFAGVMLADFLDGAATDEAEGSAASGTESVEVVAGEVFAVLSPVVHIGLVAVVPDSVDFSGHATQEGDVLVLDAAAERLGRNSAHVCIIRLVGMEFKRARAVSAGALTALASSS